MSFVRSLCILLLVAGLTGCTPVRVLTTSPTAPTSLEPVKAPSGTYQLDVSHAFIVFKVSHFGFSNYIGQFRPKSAELVFDADAPEKSELTVVIDTASLSTGNERLESLLSAENMFDSERYPEARFVSTEITRTGPASGTAAGELTIKEKSAPATLNITFNGTDANPFSGKPTLGFSATSIIKRSDWGLRAWLPAVSDTVALELEAEFFLAE